MLPKDDNRFTSRKVSIIGCGFVGASIAYALVLKDLANEIVLIDINKAAVEAEVLDIRHGIPSMGAPYIHVGDYCDTADSDMIIVTAGRNRKVGESRLDLAVDNIKILKNISLELKKYYTSGVILVVSNPVDVLTFMLDKWMELPKGTVFGTGCILDTSRFTSLIADYVGLSTKIINAQIIGEHGEHQIPLWDRVTVAGIPLQKYCEESGIRFNDEDINNMAAQVQKTGATIIAGKGKTHYGIATCVCCIADAVLNKRPTVLGVSSVLDGDYGLSNVAMSLPCIVDQNGVQRRLSDNLSDEDLTKLYESAKEIKKYIIYNKD